MKPKIWIFLLLTTTLVLYIARHSTINYIYQKTFEDSSLYDRGTWVEDNMNPHIVFLGSSMTRYTVIPSIINKNSKLNKGKTINLGADAATPYEMYVTYMKNKKKFSKTKIFFFSLEPWLFSKKYYQYKLYEKVLWSKDEWSYYMPQWNEYFSYKNSLYKVSLNKPKSAPKIKNYGYAKKLHSSTRPFKAASKKEIIDFYTDELYDNVAISEFQLNYLKKLKEEIEKNNAEFVLLYIPNHISYSHIISDLNISRNYNDDLALLLNKHLGETKQAGSYCPNDFQLKDENFFDMHHLSHTGAIKFSESLGDIFTLTNRLKKEKISLDYSCVIKEKYK